MFVTPPMLIILKIEIRSDSSQAIENSAFNHLRKFLTKEKQQLRKTEVVYALRFELVNALILQTRTN